MASLRRKSARAALDIEHPAQSTLRDCRSPLFMEPMTGQFERHAETERPTIRFSVDGAPVSALAGDTVLTAVLCNMRRVRDFEFGGDPRAGFCLMDACQDCWIWLADGRRLRACATPVSEGMNVLTSTPDGPWQSRS